MSRTIAIGLITVFCLGIFAQTSEAQRRRINTGRRFGELKNVPVTSPALGLVGSRGRGFSGRGFGFDYYRRVLPELGFRRADAVLRQSVQNLQEQVEARQQLLQSGTSELSPSGHRTTFFNYGSYYNFAPRSR